MDELVDRYKRAHRNKDVESLRSIHGLYAGKVWYIHTRVGSMGAAEKSMPALFNLDLVDVEVIELPGDNGSIWLDYARERTPTRENGFSPITRDSAGFNQPYKLLLLGRRPGEVDGPVMEVDVGMGVTELEGRLYLYATEPVLADAAGWVLTGRAPHYHRPPGHVLTDVHGLKGKGQIPDDWDPIVRPRPD